LKGKRVVIDFWATWCPPCVREIPHFVRLVNESSRDDLMVIGISREEDRILRDFVKAKGVNYPVGRAGDLSSPYADIRSIPTTFFIDRQGVIQKIFVGYHDYGDLRETALSEDYAGEPREAPATDHLEEGGT
jgi:thiol-disulfide isomerase/thioredoxin